MQAEVPAGRPTPDALVRFTALAKVGRSYVTPEWLGLSNSRRTVEECYLAWL